MQHDLSSAAFRRTPSVRAWLVAVVLIFASVLPGQGATVFVNEIHYDNAGGDAGEAIEVAGPAGTDLAGWSLVLYNGANGLVYGTLSLSGVLPDQDGGFGTTFVTATGLQNGSPDGIALVDAGSAVVQFLSYEGSFVAVGGPADGLSSVDIGVTENGSGPIGESLQLTGAGTTSDDFTWAASMPDNFGSVNTGQSFGGGGVVAAVISEIRIDQPGDDDDEYFEIAGDAGTSLDGLTYLVIGDGSGGSGVIESVTDLTGSVIPASGFFVAAEATFTLGTADLTTSLNFENSDNVTHLLVAEFSGANGQDLDSDDDGVLDVTPWTALVDLIALIEEENPPSGTELHYGPPTVGPDGSFVPGHAFLCTGGWEIGDFNAGADDTPGAANACDVEVPAVHVNEIRIDQPGGDDDEYFELAGDAGTSLDGLTYLVIGDGSGGSGVIENVTSLSGNSIPASGFFVAAESSFTLSTADLTTSLNFENGDNVTHLLVTGFSGANGQDLDTDDDGTFDVTPWTAIVALIALIVEDNPPSGTEFHYGPPTVGPDGAFVPGHAIFCPTRWEVGSFELGDDTPGAVNACPPPPIFLNEVDSDTPGLDALEFVEIFEAEGNTPLDGLVVVFYNGSSDTSYAAFDLDGFTTDADGFFVLGNSGLTPAPGLVFGDNSLQNGADAVALYVGNATDFPNGTPVTTFNLVDALVYDTNDADDAGLLVLLNAGQGQVNEAGGGDSPADSNQRCPNGFGGQRNTDAYAQAPPSPGALNNCPPLEIFEIQGDGLASLYDGFVVNTEDNVVTAVGTDGFFMQTPAARSDGDVDTSDGIFVFTGGAPTDDMSNPIQLGDLVDVTGSVQEFFDFTEFGFGSSVTVTGSGLVPPAVVFDASVPSPDPSFPSCAIEFECYEGMRVTIADGTVTGPNQRFNTDIVAEVYVTAASSRTFREPGILFPGLLGLPVWDGNPEVFELDPDKLGLPNQIIPAGSSFSATGAIGFEFGGYELWPTELTVVPAPLPDPVRAAAPGELTVATLNVFRLFDDVDDPPGVRFDGALRNDTVVSTAEYMRRLTKFSAYVREVLRSPDVLAVQEAEKLEVLEDLAARIELDDPAVVYAAYLVEGNDIGTIDVGFLVRERITVDAVTQLGLTELLSVDGSPLHDRPPLLLEGSCELEFGSYPIAVMVLHQRSLGGIEDPVDGDRVRQKRYEQAESVALKVQALQTVDPDVRLIVVGDFNAYEFTDGYVDVTGIMKGDFVPADNLVCGTNTCADLVEPDLFDEVLGLAAAERYSFIFDGSAQVLDHALSSQGLADEIRGAEYGRGNSDAALDLINDGTTPGIVPLRSSDHDGLVVYLLKDEDADGVPNDDDVCPGTAIPESVPTQGLNPNRYALVDGDGVFDTVTPPGGGAGDVFTLGDTAGCSCEQILAAQGLGNGHVKHGCSVGAMRNWVDLVSP